MTTPIIFDTDPGVDDAQAISLLLASPEVELVGLTTTFGNVYVETATRNALLLTELAGQDIPVAQGAAYPLVKTPFPPPDWIHGADGLGNQALPAPKRQPEQVSAAQFIVDKTRERPGEITLVAVGPLGNLAAALQLDPTVVDRVKRVVVMGGAVHTGGNVTPAAEANIFSDPHAAKRVLSAAWPMTLVGLDVTHKAVLDPARMKRIASHQGELGKVLQHSFDFYAEFYEGALGIDGCCPHDSCAVAWVLKPDLFTTTQGHIHVVTEGPAEGLTLMAPVERTYLDDRWQQGGVVDVCIDMDGEAMTAWMEEVLTA